MTDDDTRRLADSGQTIAPGDCLRQALPDVLPSVAAAWSVDGVVRAVPFAVSTPVLVYDRPMFAAAGLDPERPPATLPEVRAAAEQLVDRGVAPTGLVFGTGASGGGS
jgi:ABC-type glycerol-3-phosphate transport system substrate-binding protein